MMNEIITKTKGFMHITATEGDVEYLMASCDTDGARAPLAALPCGASLPRSLAAPPCHVRRLQPSCGREGWEATRAIAAGQRGKGAIEEIQGCGAKG